MIHWRVVGQNSSCGSGSFAVSSFLTERLVCETFVSEDVPLDLSGLVPFVFSALDIMPDRPVRDVNVKNLAGDFSPIENIEIFLISPSGKMVALYGGNCESDITVFNIALDDEAQQVLPCPLLGGTFRPEEPLRGFNGVNPQGEWNLRMNKGNGSGTLSGWSLELCYPAALNASTAVGEPVGSLKVYPNPANSKLWVEWDREQAEARRLELYSLTGQRVRSRYLGARGDLRTSIAVQGLPAGFYVLQLRADSGALIGYSRVVVE